MANDLATLRTRLAADLKDPAFGYWPSASLDYWLKDAVNTLYPRYARNIDSSVAGSRISAVDAQEWYALPTGMVEVDRADWYDNNTPANNLDELPLGTWLVDGANFRVNPAYAIAGYTFRLHGLGKYDLTTNYPGDELVPIIIARSSASAARYAMNDRINFRQWAETNPISSTSSGELIQMIADEERSVSRVEARIPRTMRAPVPGRV